MKTPPVSIWFVVGLDVVGKQLTVLSCGTSREEALASARQQKTEAAFYCFEFGPDAANAGRDMTAWLNGRGLPRDEARDLTLAFVKSIGEYLGKIDDRPKSAD
jgi:hypothetical protein